jgi:hypothetical protein
MIKSYNRSQLLKASLFFLLAAGCFGLAWLFFHLAFQLVGSSGEGCWAREARPANPLVDLGDSVDAPRFWLR